MKGLTEKQINNLKESTPKVVGERVRFLRKEKGLTQTELAGLVLKDRQYLYKIEKGLVTPNVSTIATLAKAMDLNLRDFFDIEL